MVLLTATQAVHLAVESQAAAAAYFNFLAERAGDSRTRVFLQGIAELESHQGQDLKAMGHVLAGPVSSAAQLRIRVEEPAPGWVCTEGETMRQSIASSVRYERQGASFYDGLADQFSAPGSAYLRLLAQSKECYAGMLEHAAGELELRGQRSFSLQEAIRNAVQAEHACSWVYRGLSTRTQDPRARSFLHHMVRFQQVHVEELERLTSRMPDERPIRGVGRVAIAKTAPLFRYPDEIGFSDALQIAFESETRASQYFAALAGQFEGRAAQFFQQLSRTEAQHGRAIHEAIMNAA